MRKFLLVFDDSIFEGENAKAAVLAAAESEAFPFGGKVLAIDLSWLLEACDDSELSPRPIQRYEIGVAELPVAEVKP